MLVSECACVRVRECCVDRGSVSVDKASLK